MRCSLCLCVAFLRSHEDERERERDFLLQRDLDLDLFLLKGLLELDLYLLLCLLHTEGDLLSLSDDFLSLFLSGAFASFLFRLSIFVALLSSSSSASLRRSGLCSFELGSVASSALTDLWVELDLVVTSFKVAVD